MKRVAQFAVTHSVTISMATVAAVVFGFVALGRLDVRLLPEVRYPSLTIQTEYPNTAPVDVENLVTRPLEEAVGVVPGLRKVHSISQAGLSQLTLEFDWSTEMDYAGLDVREKIDLVVLPEDAGAPVLLKYDPSLDPVLRIGLFGDAPLVTIRNVAEDVLKKELESLRGVAAAKVDGGLEEEIQVQVDEARLAALGISIGEVNMALAQENVNASGGRLRDRNAEYLVRTLSRFEDVDEILKVTVALRDGKPIRMADVAQVYRGHKERTTITHVDGRESVEIALYKEGDENIVDVAQRVRAHLARIQEHLPKGLTAEVLFDQSVYISKAVSEVRNNALIGGLLAIIVLYLFLRDFRSTVIIGVSIPISIVATFILMYTNDVSLNVMSLGGLALGVGMLVDNSIVVLESIHRRRQEAAEKGESPAVAVTRGTGEVAGAVMASTLTTVAVFVPIVFVVEGISGQIFRDQALTVTFSLLVSLAVALTLTPMIAALGGRPKRTDPGDGPSDWRDTVPDGVRFRWLRKTMAFLTMGMPVATFDGTRRAWRASGRGAGRVTAPAARAFSGAVPHWTRAYRSLLGGALRRRGLVLGGVALLTLGAVALLPSIGAELIPPLAQGQVTLGLEMPEGTPLSRTEKTVAEIGRALADVPGVERVAANVGISQEGGGTIARRKENRADVHLKLAAADRDSEIRVLEDVRRELREFADVSFKVRRPSLLALNAPVEVDVFGYELDRIMATAEAVAAEMEQVSGIRDVRRSTVPGSPEIRVSFDRDKLNRYGLALFGVASTVRDKLRGSVATQFRDKEKHIDVRVLNTDDQRTTLTAIRDLIVAERDGVPIRLASIASMETVRGPAEVHRLGRRRVAIVSGNLAGRDLASATAELSERLATVPMPGGVVAELGGQNTEMRRSFRSLQMAILLAVFLVYLVMAAQFESFVYPFIIMFTVPLALMGAVLGLKLTGTPLSVVAAIGAIMLAGIVVNNGIVLVDRINQLRRARQSLREAVLNAGTERFRPILMTTTTTILGLLPMALGLGEGAELRAPLAITVISGLALATLLTLFVVPVTYTLLTPGDGPRGEAEVAEQPDRLDGLAPATQPGGGGGALIMWLTRLCLRRPVTLVMMLVSIVVLGLISYGRLPLAFLPQLEFPYIGVVVPYSGGIPGEVEREISRPIEEILATLGGIRELESYSSDDQAYVGVEFEWGRNVNALRMEVQERIDQIRGDLPDDVRDIFLFTFNTNDIPIIEGRISAKGIDLSESYDLIEARIIRPLQSVPGVGNVGIDGVNPTIGAVYLRLDKIQEFNVDVQRLFNELASANVDLTVGRVTEQGLRYDVRSVSGIGSMEELGALPIDERGLRLSDIAELAYGAPAPAYGRHLNGEFAIAFWIQKASGFNTVEVCRGVEAKLEEINLDPSLQGINTFSFFNQAEQITNSLDGLWRAGLFGSLLSVVVLYIFLRRISLTLVVAISIPISLFVTGIYLYLTGGNLNVLTMMGLMLGIGMLVDNAVVVLESIHRRRILGASAASAALRGTRDVGRAIVASTLTTIIVFAPIIVTQKNQLAVWLGSVGVAISVTIVGSLLVSLTVIPALSVFLSRSRNHITEARWIGLLRKGYLRVLEWTTFRRPYVTGFAILPGIIAVTVAVGAATGFFQQEMDGEEGIRQERLRLSYHFTSGVDKKTSESYVNVVEEYLETRREDLGLRDVYSFYGSDVAGMSLFFERDELSTEFLTEVREDLRENLPVQAGVEYRFGGDEGNDSGVETFRVTVSGEDTDLLTKLAEEVKRRLAAVDGVSDLTTDADRGHPEIRIAIDRERAGRHGVRSNDIAQVLALTYRGTRLPRLRTGAKEIDLSVSLLPDDTESIENLSTLVVAIENNQPILLGQIADFEFDRSPETIIRRNQKTGVTISGSWEGEKFSEGLEKIEAAMEEMALPFGYGWNFGSRIRQARQEQDDMGMNALLALVCVFLVMASLFESLIHPGVVMGAIVFAIIGVFQFMMITATPLNIMALIGIVILIGVVVNNGIVLVDHINSQRRTGLPMDEAIRTGCSDRLRPVLMTAGTTVLGLLPLAFSNAHMGNAEYYPMARAIIGGLLSGTLLTLIVLPTYYRIVNTWVATAGRLLRERDRRRAARPAPQVLTDTGP